MRVTNVDIIAMLRKKKNACSMQALTLKNYVCYVVIFLTHITGLPKTGFYYIEKEFNLFHYFIKNLT